MPPKTAGGDEWTTFLLTCLQNIKDGNGNLIQPNWAAVAEVTGSKAHTLYCRYNTHVMKPLGLTSAKGTKSGGNTASGHKKRKNTTKAESSAIGSDNDGEAKKFETKDNRTKRVKKEKDLMLADERIMGSGKGKLNREDSADGGGDMRDFRSSDIDGEFEYEDAEEDFFV